MTTPTKLWQERFDMAWASGIGPEKLKQFIAQVDQEAREEEHQFFRNILDGIDVADQQLDNKSGGTKAIRFALQSRFNGPVTTT